MPDMTRKNDSRKGSRHRDRHMVSLPGDLYAQLQELAERTRRPIRMEIIIACEDRLKAEGLWPPESHGQASQ